MKMMVSFRTTIGAAILTLLLVTTLTVHGQSDNERGALPDLEASSTNPGELTISWGTPAPPPSDFRIAWARNDLDFLSYSDAPETHRGNQYPDGDTRSITITGLTVGETYKVQGVARYKSGGENDAPWSGPWSAMVTAVITDSDQATPPLLPPTGLAASLDSDNSVALTWTAPDHPNIASYQVLRGTSAASLAQVATGITTTEYVDNTAEAGQAYVYAVSVLDTDGNQAQSNTVSITIPVAITQAAHNTRSSRRQPAGVRRTAHGRLEPRPGCHRLHSPVEEGRPAIRLVPRRDAHRRCHASIRDRPPGLQLRLDGPGRSHQGRNHRPAVTGSIRSTRQGNTQPQPADERRPKPGGAGLIPSGRIHPGD